MSWVDPVEALEDTVEVLRGDSVAVVGDGDLELFGSSARGDLDDAA